MNVVNDCQWSNNHIITISYGRTVTEEFKDLARYRFENNFVGSK